MGTMHVFLLIIFTGICAAQNDLMFSVFTVTSKSMIVQWSGQSGASSYKITATPKNSLDNPVSVQFGSNTVMGSVNSLSPNTVYTMQLEAIDNALNVISAAATEETTAPEVPSIKQAYSKNSDSITVEFTPVSGATGYILRAESTAGQFFLETHVDTSPGTIEQLQPYTEYYLSVMSVNSGGRSQPSLPTKARTVVMAPQLNASSPTNSTIVVTWPPVESAVLYTLCIIRQNSSVRHKMNTTETTVTFKDLEAGTTYHIKGMAWDAMGRTGDELTVHQITRPESPHVTQVKIIQGRSFSLAVYWGPVNGATYYIAYTSNGLNCSSEHLHCFITPVECGQNHTVTVEAHNRAGPSSPSPPAEYITYPCPVENIWVEEHTAGNCSVMWDEVDQVDKYVTFIKRDDGVEELCTTTETTCSFFCMCGYTYFTSVFPINQAGSSLHSPIRNYTTIPCCPQNVTIQLVSTETLEIMWSPVKGAELYETTAAYTDDVIQCNDMAPVCALSDLECNTAYSVTVTPCSDLRGCNHTCRAHAVETAPCAPQILKVTQTGNSTFRVYISTPNGPNTNYTVTAVGRYDSHACWSGGSWCELTQLACGSSYEVTAVAMTAVGKSLPGYSKTLETGPCCPASISVMQVTQAMTNVTWSPGKGARSFVAALSSPRGHAKCHTLDTHCVMGCITCGTNYSVHLEAISSSGQKSECKYQGFSSSPCCPMGVKLYPQSNTTLRVYWRSLGQQVHRHIVSLHGAEANYTCAAAMGSASCYVGNISCGEVFTASVVPVGPQGVTVNFCQPRTFLVSCPGSNTGFVITRRKRSLE